MSWIIFPTKNVDEDVFLAFDFISQLVSGETISSSVVTVVLSSGVDPSPSTIISGVTSVDDSIVYQKIIDGVAGVIYTLVCAVTTSAGNVLKIRGNLAVLDTNSY